MTKFSGVIEMAYERFI